MQGTGLKEIWLKRYLASFLNVFPWFTRENCHWNGVASNLNPSFRDEAFTTALYLSLKKLNETIIKVNGVILVHLKNMFVNLLRPKIQTCKNYNNMGLKLFPLASKADKDNIISKVWQVYKSQISYGLGHLKTGF